MDVKELRDRADIQKVIEVLGVETKKMGATYLVKCPCHEDNHPSAFFKEGDNYIYCNVCRKNINAIDVIMSYKKCSFKKALHTLEEIEETTVDELKKEILSASEVSMLGVKMNDEDFLYAKEYGELLKMHLILKKRRVTEVEEFLGINMPEKKKLNKIEKQLGF